jgi:hypothetical protein
MSGKSMHRSKLIPGEGWCRVYLWCDVKMSTFDITNFNYTNLNQPNITYTSWPIGAVRRGSNKVDIVIL